MKEQRVIEVRGLTNQYLDIDLTRRTWKVFTVDREDCMSYLGGKGIALSLLYQRFDQVEQADPLGPENLLCFSMGAFLGTRATCSARFSGVTKSPLTGIMVSSSCGGPFGEALKTAGWDGMILSGAADHPVVLRIDEQGVRFQDGRDLWGLDTVEARKALHIQPREGELVIGPAGEHLVRYANIRSGNRFLGRGGMGAVMGSKRVKAIVARGKSHRILPADEKLFERTRQRALKYSSRNSFSRRYREFGTNANTDYANKAGFAAVRNFQDRRMDGLEQLSGRTMKEQYHTVHSGCRYCSILCGHKGSYPDGEMKHIPEYETVGMFGPNIGNLDGELIARWNDLANRLGMDTISAGGTIAWAMEAAMRGLRPSELSFGNTETIEKVLNDIAYLRDEGEELSRGTRWLAGQYGGAHFACHVKGLELAAYDPRASWGQGLGYAVTNRGGCHLGSYLVGPETMFRFLNPYSTRSKAHWVVFFEDIFSAVNSLHTCLFSVFSVILEPPAARIAPRFLLRLLMQRLPRTAEAVMDWSIFSDYYRSITGYPVTMKSLRESGRRIQVLERYMNVRLGVGSKDDTLPGRFTSEGETRHKRSSVVPIDELVRDYYALRGYDEQGIPTRQLLEEVGIKP